MESFGKVNRYVCEKCKAVHGTINLSTGVTPFIITCRSCGGMAQSSCYRLPAGETGCGWAWYRPTVEEFRRLSAAEQEHVLMGGLQLGDLETVVPMQETDEAHESLMEEDPERWLTFIVHAYKPDHESFQGIVDRLKPPA
jgi:hypothetical protein